MRRSAPVIPNMLDVTYCYPFPTRLAHAGTRNRWPVPGLSRSVPATGVATTRFRQLWFPFIDCGWCTQTATQAEPSHEEQPETAGGHGRSRLVGPVLSHR